MGYGLRATGYGQSRPTTSVTNSRAQCSLARRAFLTVARGLSPAALALALSACGNIEPWVKPYERQQLADPIMALDPHPISTSYTHHVFEAREGARGALGSAGGGCGCN